MTISINWPDGIIFIPQADLTFISGNIYQLDLNELRLTLKTLEESEDGSVWPTTHNHNTSLVLSGITYARSVEIINGYKIEFEDGQYTVQCVGANHNLADVKVSNQVSLIIGNSAGLIVGGSGSVYTPAQIAAAVRAELALELSRIDSPTSSRATETSVTTLASTVGLISDLLILMDSKLDNFSSDLDTIEVSLDDMFELLAIVRKFDTNRSQINPANKTLTIFDDDNITPLKTFVLKNSLGVPSVQEVTERMPL